MLDQHVAMCEQATGDIGEYRPCASRRRVPYISPMSPYISPHLPVSPYDLVGGEVEGDVVLELDHVVPHLEIHGRCTGDAGEMQGRYGGNLLSSTTSCRTWR